MNWPGIKLGVGFTITAFGLVWVSPKFLLVLIGVALFASGYEDLDGRK